MNNIIKTVAAASLILCLLFYVMWKDARSNYQRQTQNFEALANEMKAFKDTTFARIKVMNMTSNEVKTAFPELETKLKKYFDIKLKNVHQVTTTETVVNQTFKTHIRDSVVLDTIPLRYAKFKDQFLDFEAQELNNELYVTKNINRVPLVQVVSREKWKFKHLFPWNWNERALVQDVKTENPNAEIEFSRTINIKR